MKIKKLSLLSIFFMVFMISTFCFNASAGDPQPGSNEATITLYSGLYGHFEGISPQEVIRIYEKGTNFNPEEVVPIPENDWYIFGGWYTETQGRGDHYTSDTVISGDDIKLYANWRPNPDTIPAIQMDTVYPMDITQGGLLYSFTPSETAFYEAYTTDNDPDAGIASLRILDSNLITIANSEPLENFNVIVCTKLTEETTYYIEFSSVFGASNLTMVLLNVLNLCQ